MDPRNQSRVHSFVNKVSNHKSFNKGFKVKLRDDLMEASRHINLGLFNMSDTVCGRALLSEEDYR